MNTLTLQAGPDLDARIARLCDLPDGPYSTSKAHALQALDTFRWWVLARGYAGVYGCSIRIYAEGGFGADVAREGTGQGYTLALATCAAIIDIYKPLPY
jgi:hypothetical protein